MPTADLITATVDMFEAIVAEPVRPPKKRRRGDAPEGTLYRRSVPNTKHAVATILDYARKLQALKDDRLDKIATLRLDSVRGTPEGLVVTFTYAIPLIDRDPVTESRPFPYPHETARSLFMGEWTTLGAGQVKLDPDNLLPTFVLNENDLTIKWPVAPRLKLAVPAERPGLFRRIWRGIVGFVSDLLETGLNSITINEKEAVVDADGIVDNAIPILVFGD